MKRMTILALVLIMTTLTFGNLGAQETSTLVVKQFFGQVDYKKADGEWTPIANIGTRLSAGTRIRTGGDGLLRLAVGNDDSSIITLKSGTVMEVSTLAIEAGTRTAAFMLHTGRMATAVSTLFRNDFVVRTRTAVAGVRGTEFGVEFDEGAAGEQSNVFVFRGKVAVQGLNALGTPVGVARSLSAGEKTTVANGIVQPPAAIVKRDENRFEMQVNKAPEDTAKPGDKDAGSSSSASSEGGSTTSKGSSPARSGGSTWGGGIGPEVIGDKTWTKMLLAPKFQFGKLTLALYLPIYYDANEPLWEYERWYNKNEWDFHGFKDSIHDLLLKFMYIQYGEKEEDVFVRMGSIDDFVIGHGFLMNHYNNMLQFPSVRKIGLQFDLRFGAWGFESMMADIYETKVFGGRVYVMPFGGVMDKFAIGLSYITDIRTSPDINNYATVFGTGLDVELPLPDLGILTWKLFADYARLGYKTTGTVGQTATSAGKTDADLALDGGYGVTYGLKGKILLFNYQLAFRNLKDGFIPEYFNSYYDVNRQQQANDLISGTRSDYNGWLFELGADFDTVGFVKLNFQEYYGKVDGIAKTDNKLMFAAQLNKGVIPKFHASFLYERENVIGRELVHGIFDANTVTTMRLYYEVGDGVDLVGTYRRFYENGSDFTDSYGIETQIGL